MHTVLLTGANGFLGIHLCRQLLQQDYAVRAFVRPGTSHRSLEGLPLDIWTGDLRDAANVRAAAYGCDFVIHADSLTQVNPARSQAVVDINIEGTAAILAASLKANVKRLVFVGTAGVFGFGTKKNPGDELFPYTGKRYGLDYLDSKREATDLVLRAIREAGLPAVLVHPTFMLGPLDYQITFNALLLALYRQEIKGIPVGGRNYIHVADAATATINALTMGRPGQSYILGNENLSDREAFTLIADVMQIQPPTLPIPAPVASIIGQLSDLKSKWTKQPTRLNSAITAIANDGHYFSSAKAIAELNLPQTPIQVAIEEACDWLMMHGYLQ